MVDNATRWNSLYLMIEHVLKLRHRIDSFCITIQKNSMEARIETHRRPKTSKKQLKNDTLTRDDWDTLAEIMAILGKFYEYTKRYRRLEKLSRSESIIWLFDNFKSTLESRTSNSWWYRCTNAQSPIEIQVSSNTFRPVQSIVRQKLDEYFIKSRFNTAHYTTIVTNPIMKWKYFEHT